jgi:predicted enzyme related to lactoylglutathione lyase
MDALGRWGSVQVDSTDPVTLAAFWANVLGVEVEETIGDPAHYVVVGPTAPGGPWLSFQRVSEVKTAKNRLHLDLVVDDLDVASNRVEALGGGRVSADDVDEYGYRWRVMHDPEGNEFCVILRR